MDWRDETYYAYLCEPPGTDAAGKPTGMTPERWAWEFLRRNPEYQREWDQLMADGSARQASYETGLPLDSPELHIFAPGNATWGLVAYCNPQTSQPRALSFRQSYGRVIPGHVLKRLRERSAVQAVRQEPEQVTGEDEEDSLEEQREPRYEFTQHTRHAQRYVLSLVEEQAAVIVDLSKPLEPQIEHISVSLQQWQAQYLETSSMHLHTTRNHASLWQRYLRALDAHAAGASLSDIATVLFPQEPNTYPEYRVNKKVHDTLEQANKIVRATYKLILLLPQKRR